MLGVSLIIIAAAAVYMVEAYIHTYYAIEYMHGAPLFFVLLAKYAAPVLFLLLCGYFVFRYMEKRRESEKPVQDKLVNREEAYAEKIYATLTPPTISIVGGVKLTGYTTQTEACMWMTQRLSTANTA